MVCYQCSTELKDGAKYCIKCGVKCNAGLTGKANIFSYMSLIISIVGVIGGIVLQLIIPSLKDNSGLNIFTLFMFANIIFAIIILYKQKCKLAFIAGLVSWVYFILLILLYNFIL